LLISTGVGMISAVSFLVLFALISAICINNEYFSLDSVGYVAPLIQFIGILLGAIVAGKMNRQKTFLTCGLSGVGVLLFESCCAMLFFDGISVSFLYGLIATVVSVIFAILICNKNKSRSGSRKKRRGYR
jgi:peptidoglycan/LPS O-acetylase OafA/YrhL